MSLPSTLKLFKYLGCASWLESFNLLVSDATVRDRLECSRVFEVAVPDILENGDKIEVGGICMILLLTGADQFTPQLQIAEERIHASSITFADVVVWSLIIKCIKGSAPPNHCRDRLIECELTEELFKLLNCSSWPDAIYLASSDLNALQLLAYSEVSKTLIESILMRGDEYAVRNVCVLLFGVRVPGLNKALLAARERFAGSSKTVEFLNALLRKADC